MVGPRWGLVGGKVGKKEKIPPPRKIIPIRGPIQVVGAGQPPPPQSLGSPVWTFFVPFSIVAHVGLKIGTINIGKGNALMPKGQERSTSRKKSNGRRRGKVRGGTRGVGTIREQVPAKPASRKIPKLSPPWPNWRRECSPKF